MTTTATALIPAASALPAPVIEALAEHAVAARGALADNTVRALRADSALFTAWCADNGHRPIPAAASTVAAFVDAVGTDRAPATVRRYVATIAHLHRAAQLPDPTKAEAVRLALKRLSRSKGTRQRQAAAITRQVAEQMLDATGTRPIDCRDRALLLTMRDLLARRSEIVALDVADITFASDGTATALIRRSKTDQGGQGQVRLLGPAATAAIKAWIDVARITTGALFRSLSRAGRALDRLPAGDVARILKRLAARAQVDDAHGISGHSCRVGMAQDLTAHGCDLAAIMQAGRWATPAMPARYAEHLQARRGAVAAFYGLR